MNMALYLQDKKRKFHDAAIRLHMNISSEAHDFFGADIFYPNSGFIKFVVKKVISPSSQEKTEMLRKDILDKFFLTPKKSAIHQKEAFLSNDPLEDLRRLSEENGSKILTGKKQAQTKLQCLRKV